MALRDNKLIRTQNRTKGKFGVGEDQLTVEEQLSHLEDDIRRLKIEFDIYFNGAAKRPPYDTKNRVDTIIRRLGDDRTLTYAQRFHYNSLASRYTAFRDLWRRTLQGREEGREEGRKEALLENVLALSGVLGRAESRDALLKLPLESLRALNDQLQQEVAAVLLKAKGSG